MIQDRPLEGSVAVPSASAPFEAFLAPPVLPLQRPQHQWAGDRASLRPDASQELGPQIQNQA